MSSKRDILVIEDERSVSRAVEMVCDHAGMSVTAVDSATGALEMLDRFCFRLALCDMPVAVEGADGQQVIVPRKGVLELQRLLSGEGTVDLELGENHVRVQLAGIRFTSKLIDGRFPEYERVIPQDSSNEITADREALRGALQRTAILSNEKYRGIRLIIRDSGVVMQAHNPEQEEAEEELEVAYSGEDIEIGFNVNYLLDALGAVDGDEVSLSVQDGNSSCLIRKPGSNESKFVVMPMRL